MPPGIGGWGEVEPVGETSKLLLIPMFLAAPFAYQAAVNTVTLYGIQGDGFYCDGAGYDPDGYSFRSATCGSFQDFDKNIKFLHIRPGSFTGPFQVQVVGTFINGNAVPGLDGNGNNQDFALWVWNVQ